MKRSDYPFIYWNEIYHGEDFALKMQELPLIHLSKENLDNLFYEDGSDKQESCIQQDEWSFALPIKRLPFDHFCYLMQVPFVDYYIYGHFSVLNDDYETTGYVDFEISISMLDTESMEKTKADLKTFPTNAPISMKLRRVFSDHETLSILQTPHVSAEFIGDDSKKKDDYYKELVSDPLMEKWIVQSWGLLMRFFKYLETSAMHPVKIQNIKRKPFSLQSQSTKKKQKVELYRRSDLSTINYLNSLPSQSKHGIGKESSSKKPHQRRKTHRTLTHSRFKNHPKYLIPNGVPVKGSFIGPKEVSFKGSEYRVLEISDYGQVMDL